MKQGGLGTYLCLIMQGAHLADRQIFPIQALVLAIIQPLKRLRTFVLRH